jgi:hypothetical protein
MPSAIFRVQISVSKRTKDFNDRYKPMSMTRVKTQQPETAEERIFTEIENLSEF